MSSNCWKQFRRRSIPRRGGMLCRRAVAWACLGYTSAVAAEPFYMGADVSLLPFIESRGGSFRDGGEVRPMEQIMVNHGNNLFRLRLFVNPNTNYSATNGAIQDLSYTIALAQRLKATGAKILLDFHYSDTWADPGQQTKPAAWSSQNFTTLTQTVRNYTYNSLVAFRNAGVMPEMVQVGNEVTNGMLWGTTVVPPTGGQVVYSGPNQNQSWMNFGTLLNAAINGVRDVDAETPGQRTDIAIHIDGGDVAGRAQYYFNQLTSVAGVPTSSYDTMGMSFYPDATGDLTNLQNNLTYLANNYTKKVMLLEFNYPWKGSATGAQWPSTQTGQNDALVAVRDLVRNLPNNRGGGVVWWYPEAIQVPGTFIFKGGAIALFDDSGWDALPALYQFSLSAPTWNTDADGNWYNAMNWSGGVPLFAGDVANFGAVITAPRAVTVNGARTMGAMNFNNTNSYTLTGSAITLDVSSGQAAVNVSAGSHTIASAVNLADDLNVTTAASSGVAFTGSVSAVGRAINKSGAGTVQFQNVRVSGLNVQGGSVRVSAKTAPNDPSGTSVVQSLVITAGAQFDLTNNSVIWDYSGGSPIASVRSMLADGRLSSSAATKRLGYKEAGASGMFAGQSHDADAVLIKYTWAGDCNLDGQVDITDLGSLATNWQASGYWANGDLDYSGFVDITDLGMLATNWQAGVGNPLGPSFGEALAALGLPSVSVPEPAALVPSLTALLILKCRRGRLPGQPTAVAISNTNLATLQRTCQPMCYAVNGRRRHFDSGFALRS